MKTILSLLILSGLLPVLTPQAARSSPEFFESKGLFLAQTTQVPTRTIEYQWPRIENTGRTSFELPSTFRAVTYDAGVRYVEGTPYNDVHILILSPEEYESWQSNSSQSRSLGITVNSVFDAEQRWMMDLPADALRLSHTNQNGHRVDIYRVGGAGNYIGVISHSNWSKNSVEVVFNERHIDVAETILNSFDYLSP